MGDIYKIIKTILPDDGDALATAALIDTKILKVQNDITLLASRMGHENAGNIDMRTYIMRTDAIDKNTKAIQELCHGLLNIEGIMKRSPVF